MNSITYKVFVTCLTYNQLNYVKDTMDGFCMQKTDFPFVCAIIDDASTDGEQEYLKKYIECNFDIKNDYYKFDETEDLYRVFAQHKTNKNCFFIVVCLKYNHHQIKKSKAPYVAEWKSKAQYHALCEGDDYWIDEDKLQKQVSFLDNNPDYGLVYTNQYNRKEGSDELIKVINKGKEEFEDLLIGAGIGTPTTCFRMDLYNDYLDEIRPYDKNWLMGDGPIWKYMAFRSKIKFMSDYTTVYRILNNSASHNRDIEKQIAYINSGYDVQAFFINKYIDSPEKRTKLLLKAKKKKSLSILNNYMKRNDYRSGKTFFLECKKYLGLRNRLVYYFKLFVFKLR